MVLEGKTSIKMGKIKNGRETLGSETAGYAGIYEMTAVVKENPCGVANCYYEYFVVKDHFSYA